MLINIAHAISEFQGVLVAQFGQPVNLSTIAAFSQMVGKIMQIVSAGSQDD